MSKKLYDESIIEVTGLNNVEVEYLSKIPQMISESNQVGLKLLETQFKVFIRYIEKRMDKIE